MELRKTLTVREAALEMGYTMKYVYDLIYMERLPGARKVGTSWRIPARAIQAQLEARLRASQDAQNEPPGKRI